MITSKELFKTYNLKTWKQNKLQIFLSIFAIAIAVAILISLKLTTSLNDQYTISNSRSLNDGDINIVLKNTKLSGEHIKVLDSLKSEGKINYSLTYKLQNNFSNGDMNSVVDVKIIDDNYYSIDKRISKYKSKLGNHNVIINKALADKFNIKKGDDISLILKNFSKDETQYKVEDIIVTSNMLDENLLGLIILDKADVPSSNVEFSNNLATNVNIIVKDGYKVDDIESILQKAFKDEGKISTTKDIIKANKELIESEGKALGLIEMLVTLITGSGIAVTICLLTIKRKKDYVLLSIYGMKNNLLRKVILYETFMISVIGNIFGIVISLIITWFIERNVIKELSIQALLLSFVVSIVTTLVFTIFQTLIFTIIPISLSKDINLNSILREEPYKFKFNERFFTLIFLMIVLLIGSLSLYIKSLNIGGMYTTILLIFTAIFYVLSIGIIKVITKIKSLKSKFYVLAIRNIERQKLKFASCCTAMVLTLLLCGTIVNLAYSIIPNAIRSFAEDSGYNLSLNTNFNEENTINTEKLLEKDEDVKSYVKEINTTGKVTLLNGKTLSDMLKEKYRDENFRTLMADCYNNINISAIDISKEMISYKPLMGRWFTKEDVNKNYIALGNNFANNNFSVGSKVDFNIKGEDFEFTIVAIMPHSQFADNWGVYIDINSFKDSKLINESNGKLNYLIKCDSEKEKQLNYRLSKELKESVIISEKDKYSSATELLQQMTFAFICISCVSIFSSFCLIGNILMMVNFERMKEFLILNVLGAKSRDIKKIAIIEGSLMGGVAALIGSIASEGISYIVIRSMFGNKYRPSYKLDLIMIAVSVIVNILASTSVVSSIKLEKKVSMLRTE